MDNRNHLNLPEPLPIPGLRFRRWQDRNDYEQMAAVREGSRVWDQVDVLSAREEVPTAQALASTFPESQVRDSPDLLLAEIDGQLVGYTHVCWRWTEVTGTRVYLHLGYLLPHWRRQGIGRAMLLWAQQRIAALAAVEQPAGQTTFATNVSSTEGEAKALIQQAGYVAVRRLSDMVLAPLVEQPTLTLPVEVALHPLQPAHYRAVYQAWKNAFATMWTSTVESEADYQEFVAENLVVSHFDPALCPFVWADKEVVGFVLSRIQKGVGMIAEVAVRQQWQRRGIARSRLSHALNALAQQGMRQVRLFTNADNEQGARTLYEQLGFREVKQHIFYRKPFSPNVCER
jgi:mycothiol synthase